MTLKDGSIDANAVAISHGGWMKPACAKVIYIFLDISCRKGSNSLGRPAAFAPSWCSFLVAFCWSPHNIERCTGWFFLGPIKQGSSYVCETKGTSKQVFWTNPLRPQLPICKMRMVSLKQDCSTRVSKDAKCRLWFKLKTWEPYESISVSSTKEQQVLQSCSMDWE